MYYCIIYLCIFYILESNLLFVFRAWVKVCGMQMYVTQLFWQLLGHGSCLHPKVKIHAACFDIQLSRTSTCAVSIMTGTRDCTSMPVKLFIRRHYLYLFRSIFYFTMLYFQIQSIYYLGSHSHGGRRRTLDWTIVLCHIGLPVSYVYTHHCSRDTLFLHCPSFPCLCLSYYTSTMEV